MIGFEHLNTITSLDYSVASALVVRLVGLVYAIAFAGLLPQAIALFGQKGLAPIQGKFEAAQQWSWAKRLMLLPSVFWVWRSDAAIRTVCMIGVVLGVMVAVGIAPTIGLIGCFIAYLSLVTAGGRFMAYQWDNLLLEVGWMTAILSLATPPSQTLWMGLWAFAVRFMISSGAAKWISEDPSWRNGLAMASHYQTQPLPNPGAWWANLMPIWVHKLTTWGTLAVEIGLPLLVFGSAEARGSVVIAWILLQVGIMLTGNFAFFNLLTLILLIPFISDQIWYAIVPGIGSITDFHYLINLNGCNAFQYYAGIVIAAINMLQLAALPNSSKLIRKLVSILGPWRISSSYGLFGTMTTTRFECEFEGSSDGTVWVELEFKYKPGKEGHVPRQIAPYQPRLDWQCWFLALDPESPRPWVARLMQNLLENDSSTWSLLKQNPFKSSQMTHIRMKVYALRMTDMEEYRHTGNKWVRELAHTFPTITK